MSKLIKYNSDAQASILAGVETLEKAVSVTLGPAGKTVIIDEFGTIHATKDGVSVAKSIVLEDPIENIGAMAVKQISEKSNTNCGDGTTTTVVLGANIYKNSLKRVLFGSSNATQVKNGVNKAVSAIVDYIKTTAKPISSKEDIKKVALVSANFDEEIAETISEVMSKLGKDGTIKVENGQTTGIISKIVDGMTIDNPYASPYLITNQERMEAELTDPFVLIVNKKISNIQEIIPCLQSVSQVGKSLLIIADDFQEDVLAMLVYNKLQGFNILAVKSPSYGDPRKSILEDIAVSTGAIVISDEKCTNLKDAVVGSPYLGSCKRVVSTSENTVIIGGLGKQDVISARAAALRTQIEVASSEYEKDKFRERLAKLTTGVGLILCGGNTEAEAKERRDRVDDAFCAAKSALKSGIVPGGGSALLNAMKHFNDWNNTNAFGKLTDSEKIGVSTVLESLKTPMYSILKNADLNADVIIEKVLHSDVENAGYNVLNSENQHSDNVHISNMIEEGIYDSAEVVINEITNAGSIAGLLLTTDAVIVENPKNKPAPASCHGCN